MRSKNVKISTPFGILIRLNALMKCNIKRDHILAIMEVDNPLDENENLISFGPHFGEEAAAEFTNRLERIGLRYIDDYFVFKEDIPEWLLCLAYYHPPSGGEKL
ncbi:hypothetical protein F9K33_16515 [bacterium]|jgi:hypothetical protein|nr:MAG: hypothetical protein F9K33_16515 [bacterium]